MIAGSRTPIDSGPEPGTGGGELAELIVVIGDAGTSARHLKTVLAREPGVRVVAECDDGPSTLAAIHRYRPDIVFLSTRLPRLTGFDVARSVAPSVIPAFVFLTSDAAQALAAFSLNALDCVAVPVTAERVALTLRRARRRLAPHRVSAMMLAAAFESLRDVKRILGNTITPNHRAGMATTPSAETHLRVEGDGCARLVAIDQIDYLEAGRGYTLVRVGEERLRARESLSMLAHWLGRSGFVRINRSVIVNARRIEEIQNYGGRADVVRLREGTTLRVGPHFRLAVRSACRQTSCAADPGNG